MLVDAYSPPRRGGVARSAGVVGSAKSKLCRSDHPVCATSVASRYFLIGAATPPLRGGEYVRVITNHRGELSFFQGDPLPQVHFPSLTKKILSSNVISKEGSNECTFAN